MNSSFLRSVFKIAEEELRRAVVRNKQSERPVFKVSTSPHTTAVVRSQLGLPTTVDNRPFRQALGNLVSRVQGSVDLVDDTIVGRISTCTALASLKDSSIADELRQFHLEECRVRTVAQLTRDKDAGRRGKKDVGQSLLSLVLVKEGSCGESLAKASWWGDKISSPGAATAPSRPASTTEREEVLKSLRQRHSQRYCWRPS
jgi:hypothetical protein